MAVRERVSRGAWTCARYLGFAVLCATLFVACRPVLGPASNPGRPTPTPAASADIVAPPLPTPEGRTALLPTPMATVASGVKVTKVIDGLFLPTGLTFAPDGRLFFSEAQKGQIRVLNRDGTLQAQPFASLKIANFKEQGLLGLALDPAFSQNHYVYAFYTRKDGNKDEALDNRVVRFTERDGIGIDQTKIIDDLPKGKCCHNGGRIAFGPDGALYITVGDQNESNRAQNLNRLNGKILRLNPGGSVPADNPFVGRAGARPEIFAFGFRNPWGVAFHPQSGVLYVTENGEVGHDEVNRVVSGGNYGNGEVDGVAHDPRFIDPLYDSGVARLGPTGATFYTGNAMPEYRGDFFFCAFNTGDLTRIKLGGPNQDQIAQMEVLAKDDCRLDVTNAPDGSLFFASITGIFRFGR